MMTRPTASDQFPRHDAARRAALDAATTDLYTRWQARAASVDSSHPLSLFRRHAHGCPQALMAALAPHFADTRWAADMLAEALATMRADVWAAPPLRAFQGGALIGVVLAEEGPATLSLLVRRWEGGTQDAPASRTAADTDDGHILFSPAHAMTAFIATGGASISRYAVTLSDAERAGGFVASAAAPARALGTAPLVRGHVERTDQAVQAYRLTGGTGDTVMLQLFVSAPMVVPVRAHHAATGVLMRLAAPARSSSFRQMTLALLRHMRRRDAAPQFAAALAEDDFALRWQVMREFVALDPDAAASHLGRMAASDPHPEVRRSAAAAQGIVAAALAAAQTAPIQQPEPA